MKRYLLGFFTPIMLFLLFVRYAWKKLNMTEDYVIPDAKNTVIQFITKLFYGERCYTKINYRRPPRYHYSYGDYVYKAEKGDDE